MTKRNYFPAVSPWHGPLDIGAIARRAAGEDGEFDGHEGTLPVEKIAGKFFPCGQNHFCPRRFDFLSRGAEDYTKIDISTKNLGMTLASLLTCLNGIIF
jgi:hypothetical protein